MPGQGELRGRPAGAFLQRIPTPKGFPAAPFPSPPSPPPTLLPAAAAPRPGSGLLLWARGLSTSSTLEGFAFLRHLSARGWGFGGFFPHPRPSPLGEESAGGVRWKGVSGNGRGEEQSPGRETGRRRAGPPERQERQERQEAGTGAQIPHPAPQSCPTSRGCLRRLARCSFLLLFFSPREG